MGIISAIIILLIVLICGVYIYTVNHLTALNDSARNKAGEIDTYLWDRNHILEQVIEKTEEAGLPVPEEHKTKIALSLGMPALMQMSVYTQLMKRGEALKLLLAAHPELSSGEEINPLIQRFDGLRETIAQAGRRYNLAATEFNTYLRNPVASFVASRKNFVEKNHFHIAMAEVSKE